MKYSRLLLGIVVVAVTLWILIGEQMAGASADAVVNAPVVTLRADTAGTVSMVPHAPGARIAENEVVASITDPLVDSIRLQDLRMERDFAAAAAARIAAQIADEGTIRDALTQRAEIFREHRRDELRTRLRHARARLEILRAEGPQDAGSRRLAEAVDETTDRLPAEPTLHALALEHARERVAVLEIALRAAERGVFLGDGYNDAPNAEQRGIELDSRIAGLRADLAEAETRVEAIDRRVERAQVRVNLATGGELRAPVDGLFWQVLQADGVTVQRGDPILRLVDCGATFVTLSVSEGIYNDLRPGQDARFRFEGRSELYDATVTRLAGSGAATIYETLAIAPSQRHLDRFDVALIVPGLSADPELGCAIGRTGRAFFDTRPLDGLRNLFR